MLTLVFEKIWSDYICKVIFMAKNITRSKEDHFIVIKGSIHQEDIIILNVYASSNRDSSLKYIKQKWTEL